MAAQPSSVPERERKRPRLGEIREVAEALWEENKEAYYQPALDQTIENRFAKLEADRRNHVAKLAADHELQLAEVYAAHDEELATADTRHEQKLGEVLKDCKDQLMIAQFAHEIQLDQVHAVHEEELAIAEGCHEQEQDNCVADYTEELEQQLINAKKEIEDLQAAVERGYTSLEARTQRLKAQMKTQAEESAVAIHAATEKLLTSKDEAIVKFEAAVTSCEETVATLTAAYVGQEEKLAKAIDAMTTKATRSLRNTQLDSKIKVYFVPEDGSPSKSMRFRTDTSFENAVQKLFGDEAAAWLICVSVGRRVIDREVTLVQLGIVHRAAIYYH